MRILLITDGIPPVTLGGTGRIVRELGEAMAKRGHAVGIVSAANEQVLPPHEKGVEFFRLPPKPARTAHFRSVWSSARAADVLAAVDVFKPDVIHAHCIAWQAGYAWMHGAAKRKIPIIITCHDVSNIATGKITGNESALWLKDLLRSRWTWNPLRNGSIRSAFARATKVLCVSDALRELLMRHGFQNLATVHNGVDVDFWSAAPTREEARRALKLPDDEAIFLLPGRIGHDKGSHWTLESMPQHAHLVVAGFTNPAFFDHLKHRFHYFPNQNPEQMRVHYAACDVALVPSLCFDCYPTVCLEAAASGRPVIASSWGGAKESVVDGVTGWIVHPERPGDLKERMKSCADRRFELSGIGYRAKEHARVELNLEKFLSTMEKIYQEVH